MPSRLYAHTAAFCKAARCVVHLVRGMLTITRFFGKATAQQRAQHIAQWANDFLQILGVQVRTTGSAVTTGPLLVVANHISWLDILVMHAARHCRFVSKSDVQTWPLIGTFADGAGTLYVARESRRDAHRVVGQMAERLKAGDILAVFPEGTTGDGITLLHFHANLIQSAIEANVAIQPVGLRFLDAATGGVSFAPSYVGDESLMGSIWRTLSAPPLKAVVVFGVEQTANGRNRRVWASTLRADIEQLRSL